ncbi:HPr family phosphocarrier protein [Domibacillus sp. PGB-M46]|uniref:HPr family phosphocarrier protein n=1 Tax=Domibacillus sp. PGB-M46 TaxID=2910255 RepID=UPI001F5989D3|nr:HPr family phosphocarrier protein [Domibacillus sp. PGB-M46]MCI2257133.1 HPr family phosphocarrier protein [Domibacillus sp. PGB-M46]
MLERNVKIGLKEGLQSKPAAQFVEKANTFNSNITLIRNEKVIAAKSIMGVMAAALTPGTEVKLIAEGSDEEKALDSLEKFLSTP